MSLAHSVQSLPSLRHPRSQNLLCSLRNRPGKKQNRAEASLNPKPYTPNPKFSSLGPSLWRLLAEEEARVRALEAALRGRAGPPRLVFLCVWV